MTIHNMFIITVMTIMLPTIMTMIIMRQLILEFFIPSLMITKEVLMNSEFNQ